MPESGNGDAQINLAVRIDKIRHCGGNVGSTLDDMRQQMLDLLADKLLSKCAEFEEKGFAFEQSQDIATEFIFGKEDSEALYRAYYDKNAELERKSRGVEICRFSCNGGKMGTIGDFEIKTTDKETRCPNCGKNYIVFRYSNASPEIIHEY
jgi:hypothetical protein